MRVLVIAVVAVAALALTADTAHAAAPRIVIFSGQPVKHQVVVSDWPAIFRVVERLAAGRIARDVDLFGRPRLKVSMFWGPRWISYLNQGKRASALRPAQADQWGVFYAAWRGHPALIDLDWAGRWPRVVPADAIAILKRFGVPTSY